MSILVSVFPNPFDLILSFEVVIPQSKSTILRIADHQQNIIKMISWSLKKGTNKTSIEDLHTLPAGNYYVELSDMNGKNLFNTKLLKI